MVRTLMLVLSVAILSGCGGDDVVDNDTGTPDAATGGFESPQAAFDAFQAAATESDFGDGFPADFGGLQNEPAPPLDAVTIEQFNAAWQITLKAVDQPAGELLRQLADGLGLEVSATLEVDIDQPVSLDIEGRSRFEAIEEICQAIKMTPVYSADKLSLKPGARPLPVAFAGPLLIEVVEFKTRTDTATGDLSLRAFNTGLSPAVLHQLNKQMGATSIESVTDVAGNDLRRPGASGEMYSQSIGVYDRNLQAGLRNLLRSVPAIKAVQGRLNMSLPTEVVTVEFDQPEAGMEKPAGSTVLTLEKSDGGNFTFNFKGASQVAVQLLAFDSDGDRLEPFSQSAFGGGDSGSISLSFKNPPARFEARVAVAVEQLEYEFTLHDLPVPNHALMPEALPELSFDGGTPVTVQYVKLAGQDGFRKAVFTATNHSNKEVQNLLLMLHFLDADGNELSKNSSFYAGQGIPAGGKQEIEATAFFIPEDAKTVTGTVDVVEFTDASEWNVLGN